jgi:hypothetical protein
MNGFLNVGVVVNALLHSPTSNADLDIFVAQIVP